MDIGALVIGRAMNDSNAPGATNRADRRVKSLTKLNVEVLWVRMNSLSGAAVQSECDRLAWAVERFFGSNTELQIKPVL